MKTSPAAIFLLTDGFLFFSRLRVSPRATQGLGSGAVIGTQRVAVLLAGNQLATDLFGNVTDIGNQTCRCRSVTTTD